MLFLIQGDTNMKKLSILLSIVLIIFAVSCDNNSKNVPESFTLKGKILSLDFTGTRAFVPEGEVESITISINESGEEASCNIFTDSATYSGGFAISLIEGESFTIKNNENNTNLDFTVINNEISKVSGTFVDITVPDTCQANVIADEPKTTIDAFKGHMYFVNNLVGTASRITFEEDKIVFKGYTNVHVQVGPYTKIPLDQKLSLEIAYNDVTMKNGTLEFKAPYNPEQTLAIIIVDNTTLKQSFFPDSGETYTLKLVK